MRQTNWHVITGAPCSGKTSVIRELEGLGRRVVHESARAFIDEELAKGLTIQRIRADELAFERRILHRKLSVEAGLPETEPLFLDRAVPDSIAYFRLNRLDPAEPLRESLKIRYKTIFFFERLRFEKDRVRVEDDPVAEKLGRLIAAAYADLGYDLINVPVMPVKERTDFVLGKSQMTNLK